MENSLTKLTSDAFHACQNLLLVLNLQPSFIKTIEQIYLPLATKIAHRSQTLQFISINGAQGTGKSTLSCFLKILLEKQFQFNVAAFSLDDFYLTHQQRDKLSKQVHPLLVTRGVPGTHDVNLLGQVISDLRHAKSCVIPVFDKAIDDRLDTSQWQRIKKPLEIILFDGWCNHSPYQTEAELKEPINQLEQMEDRDGDWRFFVNERLKLYHQEIFSQADCVIMLKAPDFEHVFAWRRLQEQKLAAKLDASKNNKIMTDIQLQRFIQHYERITRHSLINLPAKVDYLLPISSKHTIEP